MTAKDSIDFDVEDFALMLSHMPEHLPIAGGYAQDCGTDYTNWFYTSEREHMVCWFRAQTTKGSGSYTRSTPNHSAKRTYNRLMNATSVLWIGEALGIDPDILKAAVQELKKEKDYRRRPAIVRRHIPWDTIAPLAQEKMPRRRTKKLIPFW